jgi:hypothetical protein
LPAGINKARFNLEAPLSSKAFRSLLSHRLFNNHTRPLDNAGSTEAASDGHRQATMMKRVTVPGLRLRPTAMYSTTTTAAMTAALRLQQQLPSAHAPSRRRYATQHQQQQKQSTAAESRRRAVTPFNDDGRVPWTDLSAGEKTGRAAQQTFNFGMVIAGLVLTVRPDPRKNTRVAQG